MTDETIVEVRDLVRHFVTRKPLFGQPTVVRAVDGVSFDVPRGETFAIVGESGCGKSTLARLLIRLLDPDSGAVIYRGRNLADLDATEMRRLRRELQFVFQDPFSSLNPRMTVGALIEEPMRTHRVGSPAERRSRVAELLARVGLRAGARGPLSARVLGRPASAHRHRPGARLGAAGDHRRRARLGPRCLGAGAGHQPARGPEGRVRPDADHHRP